MFQKLGYWVGSIGLLFALGCNTEPLFEAEAEHSESSATTERRASVVRQPAAEGALPDRDSDSGDIANHVEDSAPARQTVAPSRWPGPVENYHQIELALHEILEAVVDDESAQAASEPLIRLTAKAQGKHKAMWLWAATAPNHQVSSVLQERGEVMSERFSGGGHQSIERALEIAQRPGNTEFRAALLRFYDQLIAESPPTAGGKLSQMVQPLR